MSGFYVGYLPKAPTDLASFVRRVVSAMLLLVATLGPLLIISQQRFGASAFEWQQVRTFQGVVQESPYPTLLVRRPGIANPGEEFSRYLLVGVGKHGASSEMSKFDGNTVSLQGKLIYRDGQTLIEVMPASVSVVNSNPSKATEARYLGKVSLQGEIVDSKCYLGVMNPGHGKVHRDCAVRCISGGIPPALLARGTDGQPHLYLLTSKEGVGKEPRSILGKIGQPVRVEGELIAEGDTISIRAAVIERD